MAMIAITPFGKPSIIALRRKEENKKLQMPISLHTFILKMLIKFSCESRDLIIILKPCEVGTGSIW